MKRFKWLLLLAILALAVWLGMWIFNVYRANRLDPEEMLAQSLANTANSESFRYRLESLLLVEGRREVISRVEGEKNKYGSIHVKGEMVKTPVDIYHLEGIVYSWDPFSKRWLVIKDVQGNSAKVLMAELDPLSNFNFKNVGEVKKVGWETWQGKRCAVFSLRPSVENELMEILWRDFAYKVWVDPKELVIAKAQLTATSKNNPDTFLKLHVSFFDYNKSIKIEKPSL